MILKRIVNEYQRFIFKKGNDFKNGAKSLKDDYKIRYRSSKFSNQKIELDGKSYIHCEFKDCLIILERGETELSGCSFKNCKLLLKGNAYTVGKIIRLFTGRSPLKVLDMEEPLFGEIEPANIRKENDL